MNTPGFDLMKNINELTVARGQSEITGFKSAHEIRAEQGHTIKGARTKMDDRSGIYISTNKNGSNRHRYCLVISIGLDLLKSIGVIDGDRVEIFFNESAKQGLICRSNSEMSAKVGFSKNNNNKARVQIQYCRGLPSVASTEQCENPRLGGGGLIFDLPENCSFESNLKAKKEQAS
jgi:hypothetical protein